MDSAEKIQLGLSEIAHAIEPSNWIAEYQTLIAGGAALLAALITACVLYSQMKQQRELENKKVLEDKLSLLGSYLADLGAIIVACKEYRGKLDVSANSFKDKQDLDIPPQEILAPFSSHFYNELFKSNGILHPDIAAKIAVFYNAIVVYERVMKKPRTIHELNIPSIVDSLKNIAEELENRAKELEKTLSQEFLRIEQQRSF